MKIESITIEGLKATKQAFLKLGALTAIIGPNRTGKSTIRDAVIIGLLGRHPSLGATNQAIMEMAGGPVLDVKLDFGSGTQVARRWERKGKAGTISKTEALAPDFVAPDAIAFWPADFMAMGPKDRLGYLATLASAEEIQAALNSALEAFPDLLDSVAGSSNPQEALAGAEKIANNARLEAKREADRLKKALQETRAGIPHYDGQGFDCLKIKVSKAQEDLANARAAWKNANDHVNAIGEAINALDAMEPQPNAPTWPIPSRTAEELQGLQDRKKAAPDGSAREYMESQIIGYEKKLNELEREADELKAQGFDKIVGDLDAVKVQIKELAAQKERFEAASRLADANAVAYQNEIDRLQGQMTEAMAGTCECPVCGTSGDDFKTAFTAFMEARITKLVCDKSTAGLEALRATEQADQIEEKIQELELEEQRLKRALYLIGLEEQIVALGQSIQDTTKALAGMPVPLNSDELARLSELITQATEWRAYELAFEAWTAKQGVIVPSASELKAAAELRDGMEAKVTELETQVKALEAQAFEAQHFEGETQRAANLADSYARAVTLTETTEAQVAAIDSAKALLLQAVWKPITDVATPFLASVFEAPGLQVVAQGSDIGISDAQGFRVFDVLSGSERAALSFAISCALATRGTVKVAMIDELNRMDTVTAARFLAGVQILVSTGTLEQVLVFDHAGNNVMRPANGWDVYRTVPEAEAQAVAV